MQPTPIVGVTYLWDSDVVAEEAPRRLDGSADWDKATRWHFEPGTFRPLAKETAEGQLLHIVNDHLGTPREMFAEDGGLQWAAGYTTWGTVRGVRGLPANDDGPGGRVARASFSPGAVSGNLALKPTPEEERFACPIRFQGQWEDAETGLYYNRFRHYDPLAGQYVSADPMGFIGGLRPQAYAPQPTGMVDPLGLENLNNNDAVGNFGLYRIYVNNQIY